ncbi:MAG: two-component sensor histidine kinase [Sphingobacteriales bacterium 17-39-43]|uniref:sensor histidine kinase n=1 Tax=Daejeonella sp. TaxID=2805397 RepID=UPI000BDB1529|nr:ATP-binding protein [Daejeonella sp.]OYX99425.1 MAG: two-component sensor histidine kinase [Sphingobacteriia bacterium 35-40-5]OYZ32527.1 MAG: two-component sensor histidine kinase [Sphingobacteriales bacterium 16-39-50]OZA25890.1 MAG: two-component sensor histidine kinase [Sphingobacteriales bacterium 17-39-43]HQT21911.1 ATP-binding protein [Daejeonella sp.]HQT57218.1 ATP-binding protein [Daejeonella sp.]
MKLWVLVFINALAVALSLSIINFYFQQNLLDFFITFSVSLLTSYLVFYYLIERFVYSKIKLIYKLIHNLKLGKDLKDALGEYVSADPINDVELEVKEWARDKKSEIDQLKDQEKFRREFLSNISHELKTPLFAIQGYIEALQEGDIDDPEISKQFLEKASRNVDRLAFFIKDLDAISKLESGEIPVNYDRFNLTDLIHEVIDSLELKAKKYNITLLFKEKYHSPTWVYADREKIRQVLVNLIDNSFKYGKSGGSTSIKTFELHDQILVEITDDGIGIEEKYLPRLFERFYRTDKSRSRQIGGSGLGLAIVKHIIEAHQQTITVRSTENIGSTFGFTLQRDK